MSRVAALLIATLLNSCLSRPLSQWPPNLWATVPTFAFPGCSPTFMDENHTRYFARSFSNLLIWGIKCVLEVVVRVFAIYCMRHVDSHGMTMSLCFCTSFAVQLAWHRMALLSHLYVPSQPATATTVSLKLRRGCLTWNLRFKPKELC
jgi:hypothetical protein